MKKKRSRPIAPAPHPSSAMAFVALFIMLALAGLALNTRDQGAVGASIASDQAIPVGEGYGLTCSKIVVSTMEINDCCSTMCKPYAKTDAYGPCWVSCYKRGMREWSIIV